MDTRIGWLRRIANRWLMASCAIVYLFTNLAAAQTVPPQAHVDLAPPYLYIHPPHADLDARQAADGKWGYVRVEDLDEELKESSPENQGDEAGEDVLKPPKHWQIAPSFDEACLFQEGIAAVKVADQWGFIDEKGEFLVRPQYAHVADFWKGYAPVCLEDRWGYLDRRGAIAIPLQFEEAGEFQEGLAPVKKEGKWGYIDVLGNYVIPPQFDDAVGFSEGLAVVYRGEKRGFILKNGSPLNDMLFDRACSFHCGRAMVKSENRWGILDQTGQLLVSFELEDISPFYREGLAAAKVKGKWGHLDLRGKWAVQPIYDRVGDFANGLAVVVQEGELRVIDPQGNVQQKVGPIELPPEGSSEFPELEVQY